MAAAPSVGSPDAVPTQHCPRCRATVPVGVFCGRCGADMTRPPGARFGALRPGTFVVAPREPLLAPIITSTLFPQLPHAYRNPFRIGMALMLGGVVALSALGLLAPLVTLVALGVPALFMLYLWQSGVPHDIPGHAFALATGLGAVSGVAWVWFTGRLVARAYGVPMAAGFLLQNLVGVGLVIAVGGVVLMMLPAVVVRVLMSARRWIRARQGPAPRQSLESLDGFTLGALGALSFTAAATTTRLAPQFVAGLLDGVRPMRRFIEAVLYGVAAPVTATALGGLIGTLLWFRPGPPAAKRRGRVRLALVLFTLAVVAISTTIWVIDETSLPRWPQLGLHILMTAVALLAARFCIQLALLHEHHAHSGGQPVLCLNCRHVVPEMPFCPACGFASQALSRSTRRQRRDSPPTRNDPTHAADV